MSEKKSDLVTVVVMYGGQRRFAFKTGVIPRVGDFVIRSDTDDRWYVERITWHVSCDNGVVANIVLQARLA